MEEIARSSGGEQAPLLGAIPEDFVGEVAFLPRRGGFGVESGALHQDSWRASTLTRDTGGASLPPPLLCISEWLCCDCPGDRRLLSPAGASLRRPDLLPLPSCGAGLRDLGSAWAQRLKQGCGHRACPPGPQNLSSAALPSTAPFTWALAAGSPEHSTMGSAVQIPPHTCEMRFLGPCREITHTCPPVSGHGAWGGGRS